MVAESISDNELQDEDLERLFTVDRYEAQQFQYGSIALTLMCSPSACTDYDLTGQIIWPAARLLADYLAENPSVAAGVTCACELGSGLGLAGLVCGQLCPACLTDHNPIVLRVLQQNVDLNQRGYPIRCMLMDWGDDAQISSVRDASRDGQGFQLLLGADVCYNLIALPKLFHAASRLLADSPTSVFLLAYVPRSTALDKGLAEEAESAGFVMEEVPGSRQRVDGGAFEGLLYKLYRRPHQP